MGLFDFVGDAISSVAGGVTSFLKPIGDAVGSISNIVSPISSAFSSYQNLTGQNNELTLQAIREQIQGQRDTNAANTYEAALNRMWQEGMSSTAHRREMIDLVSAGLNPILAANKGAVTTGGAQATMQNPYEGTASAINEARKLSEIQSQQIENERRRISNETQLKDSTLSVNKENESLLAASAENQRAQRYKNIQDGDASLQNQILTIQKQNTEALNQAFIAASTQEKLSNASLNSAVEAKQRSEKVLTDYDINERGISNNFERYMRPARSVLDTVGSAVDLIPKPVPRYIRRP